MRGEGAGGLQGESGGGQGQIFGLLSLEFLLFVFKPFLDLSPVLDLRWVRELRPDLHQGRLQRRLGRWSGHSAGQEWREDLLSPRSRFQLAGHQELRHFLRGAVHQRPGIQKYDQLGH